MLAVALGLAAAACATPPKASVAFGSGTEFVPEVADSLGNAGLYPSVAVTSDGQPYVAYFAFPDEVPKDQTAPARPIGLPSVPGVLLATVKGGIWTRGAIAMAAPIQNVAVAFDPATDKAIGDLTPENVTGLQLVVDSQGGLHAAWGASNGLWYASGSGDPVSTTPWTLEHVAVSPPFGLSLAVDQSGAPWISYYTSAGANASVILASKSGSKWSNDEIATATSCTTCSTGIAALDGGPVVAYADGSNVMVSSNDHENGFQSFQVATGGGQGLAATADANGTLWLSYFSGTNVVVATGSATSLQGSPATTVGSGSADAIGARTSIAVDDNGQYTVGWYDADGDNLGLGTGQAGSSATPVGTDSTSGGAYPSVAVAPDGSTSYLAWYERTAGTATGGVVPGHDLFLGSYGTVSGLGLAIQSPTPTSVQTVAPPTTSCTQAKGGKVTVVAQGIAFDTGCIEEPANTALAITFENKDSGIPHNIEIYTADPSKDPSAKTLFVPAGNATITGPDTTTYDVPDVKSPGDYYFFCVVHPTQMFGTFTVK